LDISMQLHVKEVIIPEGSAKPLAPYSPGIRWNGLVFVSGQIGLVPQTGKLIAGGVQAETRQALQNLSAVLKAAGSTLLHTLKVTVYLKDIDDYALVNQVYAEFFSEKPPARAIVQGALPAGASVEFDAIAATSKE
jgi:2-iminobutanoate/2-iminopropanoate deaminase